MKNIKSQIIEAIQNEPELTDEMPDAMFEIIRNDKKFAIEAFRIVVRQTKNNILENVNKILETDNDQKL